MPVRHLAGPQGPLLVDDAGAAHGRPAVLFVHSDGGNVTQWREALAHLRPGRRAVALDLRGHGGSAPPADGDYTMVGRAADVAAVVDALDLAPVVLVGHSGGAGTALEYAARHPDRVAGLLLVDPATAGRVIPEEQRRHFLALLRSPAYAETVRDYYANAAGPNVSVRERVVRDVMAAPPATLVGTFEALAAWDPAPALAGYRGARLALVTPRNDGPGSLHRIDPTLPHQVVPDTGHWIHLDAPAVFTAALDDFLAGRGRAEG